MPADHVDAVGPAVERGARLVARHLGRQRRNHRARQVGRVGHHQVEARRASARAARRDRPARTRTRAPSPSSRTLREATARAPPEMLDRQHLGAGPARGDRAGDGAAAGAEVGDHRLRAAGAAPRAPTRPAPPSRARDQHVGRDREPEPVELLPAEQVLERLARRPAAPPAPGSRASSGRTAGARGRGRARSRSTPSSEASSHSASGRARLDRRPPRSAAAARARSAGTVRSATSPITARSAASFWLSVPLAAARRSARRGRPPGRRAAGAA